jgi:hypothetical protein
MEFEFNSTLNIYRNNLSDDLLTNENLEKWVNY